MDRLWPFTGRDAELRDVVAAVRPGAAGILVAGPAGVGKTRLVREAVARAAGRRRVVWALGANATRLTPFGAFAGLLDLPVEGAAAVAGMLRHLLRLRPFVLAVDDAHLLDELSAVVLHRVVVRGIAPVVVTVRDPAPAPDVVVALWKDDLLPRLDVAPLDPPTTSSLVARVLDGPVESGSAQRLWALTRGSPLFLRHLLAEEVRTQRLSRRSGLWLWSGDPRVSAELATLVDREIGGLEPPVLDVVDLLALGEPLGLDALTALTSRRAVEEAETRGLVGTDTTAPAPVARLAHPVYGEVRRSAMGMMRARHLRGVLASHLEGTADPIARAVLLLDSDLPPDHDLLLRAAEAATAFHDLPLAERLAHAAAAGGGWRARLAHAATLSWLTRGEAAEAALCDLAGDAPSGPWRARARAYRAGNLLFTLRRLDAADEVLAEALADPDAGAQRPTLEAMGVALDVARGRTGATVARALALLDDDPADQLTRLLATSALAAVGAVTGRLDAVRTAGGAGDAAALQGIPAFGLTDWLVTGLRLAGLPVQAQDVAARLASSAADLPGPARVMGLVLSGHAALAAGRPADALAPLRDAWAGLDGSEHEFRFRCRTLLATAYGLTGRADAARPLLDGLVDTHPAYTLHAPDDLLARAWCVAAEGAVTPAVRLAEDAADLARRQDSPAYEVLAWQTATQLGASAPAASRLEALTRRVEGPRAGAALQHARASCAQDPAALLDAADAWERLGDPVAAGDAAAHASELHRRRGRRGSALSAAARAQGLADRSGARTPALLAAVRPLPLTVRERESAVLAAQGLSNRAIAERLTLSVRTVEGHLYRAGRKLGVSDRAALARLVRTPGSE
ncbi:helix-turn-helix transcriptional regulator [Cellulomonas dongxiuzhuiae]|uniref:helix-turn-helix transcriptional regulator n=1 Tax=Cellulomonas dongxiuzhuiae TaxID=2819979 RepID=UPI001AAECB45|nr:LuxR family transcriptional regulator [Cellulomonas dongxiuzhuiae]MBO3088852.1 AAA family ATPase [Cellulomonas dongxiuzhuiae]